MGSNRPFSEECFGNQCENGAILMGDDREFDQDLRLIRLFNHYRHDWMNEIQLIFGYVKLRKYEKLESLMHTIKLKVQRESNISKLGVPELIVYIFSVQAEVKELKLEVEMEHEIHLNELSFDCKRLTQLLIAVIEVFKEHAVAHHEHEHSLLLKLTQTVGELIINVNYQCDKACDQLLAALERVRLQSEMNMTLKTNQWDGHSIAVNIELPLNI
ncbi:Sensor_kinase_SpoOB-type, alpha-helical domain [Paenibacillus sp. 1_12]|uniref:Spo0B domain-containing protein n=1 Tax=Paenibacillus sp. 1_12 TaxID=1566278 RepID=UPI0008F3E5D7|nr:Spo0B domain-containing protein [Paenibacillus sp. 1_12]SFK69624.1 Sensor_kinase_SpoOB-type, alpha-helical domain [Paenibacillus sp. 1_12]